MLGFLGIITGLAGPLAQIANKILDLQLAKNIARTETEKEDIEQKIQEAHDRRAVIIAEAGSRLSNTLTATMRFLIALGPTAFLLKVLLYDKVIGAFAGCTVRNPPLGCVSFSTDSLDTNLWWVIFAAVSFYFLYDISARLKR